MTEEVTLTPAEATAKLDEMTVAYRGGPPSDKPQTPAEAKAQLDDLSKDKGWADKLMAGDVAARREFDVLTKMQADADDRLEGVLNGTAQPQMMELTTPEHPLSTRDLQSGVDGLREAGVREEVIRDFLRGEPVSKETRQLVERFQAKRHGDAEWVKKLLAGDHEANRELTTMSIVLSAPIAE